jgi:hypothetical protein
VKAAAQLRNLDGPHENQRDMVVSQHGSAREVQRHICESLRQLERWVESHDYKAYEPFDGLSSSFRWLTFDNLLLERLLLQTIRQSPINLRPLLGVKPLESTKGRGYMAAGYLAMFKATGDTQYAEKAVKCLEWLIEHKSPRFEEFTWANYFDFASRGGRYPKDEPIIVWTALVAQAFLDGYEALNVGKYLDVAVSSCEWILSLSRERTDRGSCISYHALHQASIHNANMLGAAVLARTGRIAANAKALEVAKDAMEYSCSRQLEDGAWYYGEKPHYHWIDNFHTGYNLDSLKCYIENTGDRSYDSHLRLGFDYYTRTFFRPDWAPKYYHNRLYPIDSQCVAQSIETFANFADYDGSALMSGCKVAMWAIANMQDPSGYFYYRRYPLMISKAPMLHWAQATTYKGLAALLLKLTTGL